MPVGMGAKVSVPSFAGEVGAGELTVLIGSEDLQSPEPPQRLFQGIDTEVGVVFTIKHC
jgi:hypothetical protein